MTGIFIFPGLIVICYIIFMIIMFIQTPISKYAGGYRIREILYPKREKSPGYLIQQRIPFLPIWMDCYHLNEYAADKLKKEEYYSFYSADKRLQNKLKEFNPRIKYHYYEQDRSNR